MVAWRGEGQGLYVVLSFGHDGGELFAQPGFQTITHTAVPQAVQVSEEFQGVCPVSATVMRLQLADVAGAKEKKRSLLPPAQLQNGYWAAIVMLRK